MQSSKISWKLVETQSSTTESHILPIHLTEKQNLKETCLVSPRRRRITFTLRLSKKTPENGGTEASQSPAGLARSNLSVRQIQHSLWNMNLCLTCLFFVSPPPPPPSQTHRPSRCRPNNPSPWQTKHQAGQSGHIALPLAHCTFFGQLEFHSYLWRRVTVGGL